MKNNLHRIILISVIVIINSILLLTLIMSIKDAIISLKTGQRDNQVVKEVTEEEYQSKNNNENNLTNITKSDTNQAIKIIQLILIVIGIILISIGAYIIINIK